MASQPKPYDLADPRELARLFRECAGYLQRGGTDIEGRRYAREALEEMLGQMRGDAGAGVTTTSVAMMAARVDGVTINAEPGPPMSVVAGAGYGCCGGSCGRPE